MSKYTQNLYDVGAFFDRVIPTRNEFFGMVGSPKAPTPESTTYEQRLKNMFPTGNQEAPMSVQDKIKAHAQATADLQKRLALMKEAESFRTSGKDGYVGDKNMQAGWDEVPKGTSFLPAGEPNELFRFTKNPEMFNQDAGQQPSYPASPAPQPSGDIGGGYQAASAPSLEVQIQNLNAQTIQGATGKQQEVETMTDLQKMARAYFGGRTQEQKQKEMFMNIAAGLAAGKSPRFMDNLGSAVSGAITYGRDDTNRREKEALAGMIDIQRLDDTRANNQMDNEIQRERNEIGWANNDVGMINATRERQGANDRLRQLDAQAKYLAKMAKMAQDSGQDPSPYIVELSRVTNQMGEFGGMTGGESGIAPPAASADIVYEKSGKGFKQVGEK